METHERIEVRTPESGEEVPPPTTSSVTIIGVSCAQQLVGPSRNPRRRPSGPSPWSSAVVGNRKEMNSCLQRRETGHKNQNDMWSVGSARQHGNRQPACHRASYVGKDGHIEHSHGVPRRIFQHGGPEGHARSAKAVRKTVESKTEKTTTRAPVEAVLRGGGRKNKPS